jgi:hypothetical protein
MPYGRRVGKPYKHRLARAAAPLQASRVRIAHESHDRLDVLVETEQVRRIESVLQGDETATRRQNSTVRHHRAASVPAALPFDNLDCALPERRDPKTQTVIGYHFTARLPRRGLRLMCGLDVRAQ